MLGLVLIYATNLHHLFIRAMVDSYQIFSPVKPVMIGDATTLMLQMVGKCFTLAIQMSAPLIVFALIFNIATGFVGRIMPNFPVFFAATPLSVLFGLSIFALGLGAWAWSSSTITRTCWPSLSGASMAEIFVSRFSRKDSPSPDRLRHPSGPSGHLPTAARQGWRGSPLVLSP